jgi:hypothetical protein
MLKEADLRVGFTELFTSATAREHLDRETLQKRLLLCIYGLGTNIGLRRASAGDHGQSERDLYSATDACRSFSSLARRCQATIDRRLLGSRVHALPPSMPCRTRDQRVAVELPAVRGQSMSGPSSDCYPHGCPCGFHGDPTKDCTCAPSAIARYQKRLSGPRLDRNVIHLTVPRVEYEQLADVRLGESSATVRARVEGARARQAARFAGSGVVTNAEMGPAQVREWCALDAAGEGLMRAAMRQLQLSARGYHRVLKLSRTIADLAGADRVGAAHLAEALQYRPQDAA